MHSNRKGACIIATFAMERVQVQFCVAIALSEGVILAIIRSNRFVE